MSNLSTHNGGILLPPATRSAHVPAAAVRVDAADVTILLPTYNRCTMIGESLASILGQSSPPGEIIVIDDGSTDDTEAVVRGMGDRVRYLRKDNGGKATAINLGMAAASGSFILVMDDDDLLPPIAIERHLGALTANPAADFSYGRFSRFDGDPAGASLSEDIEAFNVADDRRLSVRLMERCFLTNPTWMARRSALDRAGPYSEVLRRGQDYDMILRLARHNDGAFINEIVLWQRQHVAPRGPASERVTTRATIDLWISYSLMVIDRLDDEWSDADFAPYRGKQGEDGGDMATVAMLERATLLFAHKSYVRAMAHFARYRAALGDRPPSRLDRRVASHLLGNRYSVNDLLGEDGRRVAGELRALRFPLALRAAFAKQLRWRIREAVSASEWSKVRQLVRFGRRAFGWTALAMLPVG